MAGKSKGKQKAIQAADTGVTKSKDHSDRARDITKQLRKGQLDLKPLGKVVVKLALDYPSAITLLCLAKVELALAVDGLMSSGVLEFTGKGQPHVELSEANHLRDAVKAACQGAEGHLSLLCARFFTKLMEIKEPGFERLALPRNPGEFADPATELLEQLQSPPLEFETWDKEKDSSSTEFKTGMVMEIERARISSLDRRKPTSVAFDIAEGIFHSGLLYESQRVHLGQILQRRQAKSQQHEKVLRHHHTQLLQASLQQLAANGQPPIWDDMHTLQLMKAEEDDEAQRSTRAQGLKKQQEQKKESEAQTRSAWFDEVVAYVQSVISQHKGNDDRLAALHNLTCLPLGALFQSLPDDMGDKDSEEGLLHIHKVVDAIKSLVPANGFIGSSTSVYFDEKSNTSVPDVEFLPQILTNTVTGMVQAHSAPIDDLRDVGIDPAAFVTQVATGSWGKWTGQVPSDMSPLSSISAFDNCLKSLPSGYNPTPLDEPSAAMGDTISAFMRQKVAVEHGAKLEGHELLSSGRDLLLDILKNKTAHQELPELTQACLQGLAGGACDFNLLLDGHFPELHPPLDTSFLLEVSAREVGVYNNRPVERFFYIRGQTAVSLMEQLPSPEAKMDAETSKQLFETHSRAYNLDDPPFRMESRLEGRQMSASSFVSHESPNMANGHDDSESDSSTTTDDAANGNTHTGSETVSAWWHSALDRFSTEEMRAAFLEEVRLALHTLSESGFLTAGIASAISGHINRSLLSSAGLAGSERLSDQSMLIEHARLLQVEPLRTLLYFLWTQLGLRWTCLPVCKRAAELVVCQARSTYEFLDNETVRYSGAHLRHLGADAAAEKAAREEEAHAAADKKEVDADAQEAADQEQKPQLQLLDTKQQKDALLLQLQQQHALKSCCAFDKPEVTDDFLRYFVQHVFSNPEGTEAEVDEDANEIANDDQRVQAQQCQHVLESSLAEAVAVARQLGLECAHLVYEMDAWEDRHLFPHRSVIDEESKRAIMSILNPAAGEPAILEALRIAQLAAGLRKVAGELSVDATTRAHEVKKNQLLRARQVQSGFRGHHMDTLMNMGILPLRGVESVIKKPELYNGVITQTQEACDRMSDELAEEARTLRKEKMRADRLHELAERDQGLKAAVKKLNDYQCECNAYMSEPRDAVDKAIFEARQALAMAVDGAVTAITRLSVHLDMLVLQIEYHRSVVCDTKCESLENDVWLAHSTALRKHLVELAKQNKEATQKQAADKTMQELLAADEESKLHTAEGAQKKAKKKKKGAKARGEKQEETEQQQQDQEPIPEDWENEAPTSLPPGLQNGNTSSTRSPSPASSLPVKDEDYWRQLSGPTQDEDWSTVDKKKDRKGKAVPKQADATAALATTTSNWDTADDDGWEDAGNLLDPEPGPPGLQPQPDASASTSDQNGHQPAVPTGRSDSDVQCDKCGKWGHPASKCTEEFCDRCQQKGHSIKNCKQRHQRGEGAKRASEDRAREARLADSQRDANIQCHRCGQYGHRIANCHIPDSRGAQQCFNCQQLGHTAGGCTNPPVPRATPKTAILVKTAPLTTSRRHADVKASQSTGASQAGPTDQEEQQRGRGKGRGSRDQPADGSNTLPLTKPGRRGQGPKQAQQDQLSEYPTTGLPPGIPIPGSTDAKPPPPASPATWGPARSANQLDPKVSKPDPKSDRPRTPGWGQSESLQDQAGSHAWNAQDDDDDESYHSLPASPLQQSPHRGQGGEDPLHPGAVWGSAADIRPSSARSLGLPDSSAASTSGSGQAALPSGLLQPGMEPAPGAWSGPAFGPHSSDPQLPHRLHDQLASTSDPVISPAFAHRSAPARPSYQPQQHQQQQQQGWDPAGPLKNFVQQEQAPAQAFDQDSFLDNLLNEQQMDNRPVTSIYPAAPVGVAGSAQWPGLGDAPPVGPGGKSWAARLDVKVDALSEPEPESEDEDLQKALQASLVDNQSEQKQIAYAQELMSQGPDAGGTNGVSVVGLRNATGEYNCFLNVIIQCLWHCHHFRKQVMRWDPAAYQDNAVVTALIGLFTAFAERENSQAPSQAVDPTQLRVALGNLEGDKFRVGQMGDAAEVLGALYEKLAAVAAQAGQPTLLDDNFGLDVKESVHCKKCNMDTHQHSYVQYFFNVMSTSIAIQAMVAPGQPLGLTLKDIEDQSYKSCDTDKGGCNEQGNTVQHILQSNPPRVFTMQLAWQTNNEASEDITQAMNGMTEELDLGDVYLHVPKKKHVYHIRSMVCYYGQHYLAFVLMPDNVWFMFDDASMQRVGDWASVIKKCALGRTQASVLFFEHK